MILKNKSLIEKCLEIYEVDYINGGEVLILKAYCCSVDGGVFSLNAPQIFNKAVYEANKVEYDRKIQEFRNSCSINDTDTTLLASEIEQLKSDNEKIMLAIAELAEGSEYNDK